MRARKWFCGKKNFWCEFRVAIGNHDITDMYTNESMHSVVEWYDRHPSFYNTSIGYDIGLIRVKTPFELGPRTNIYPACLLFQQIYESDFEAIICGFV